MEITVAEAVDATITTLNTAHSRRGRLEIQAVMEDVAGMKTEEVTRRVLTTMELVAAEAAADSVTESLKAPKAHVTDIHLRTATRALTK